MTSLGGGCTRTWVLALVCTAVGCSDAPEEATRALADPTWQVQYTDTTALFIALHAVDSNTVWVAGTGGRVGRTVDGGTRWAVDLVPGADSLQFRDVHAFSEREAFVLSIGNGTDSRIYRTRDGGISWNLSFQNEDPNAFYDCLAFWDRERGFAFSDSQDGEFTLLRTVDGGMSWERIDPDRVPDARPGEGSFASSGTCVHARPGGRGWFVTGASGVDTRVIRTVDYGENWIEAPTPLPSTSSNEGLSSIDFLDDHNGAIFGGDWSRVDSLMAPVAITADGGDTWTLANPTGLGGSVSAGSYVPGAPVPTLIAVAPTGSEFSTDNGWSWIRIDDRNYWTVEALDADRMWGAGVGHISRLVNGAGRE